MSDATMDVLSDILSHMKLAGTLYFRTSFTGPWSVRVPSFENVARFHFVRQGRCYVRVDPEKPPFLLEQGDLIIITRGAAHTLYLNPESEHRVARLDSVLEQSGFTGQGTLVYGNGNGDSHHATQLVCGHFAFTGRAHHPLIEALPDAIQLQDYGESAGAWMESTLRMIGEESDQEQLGSALIARKLSEVLFAQALRVYLSGPGARQKVMAGFADQRIASVLTAIHKAPSFNWTLSALADIANLSRTAFVTRFTRCMVITPMAYITHWRMQLARERLLESNDTIVVIADSSGYQSEAAFGRVFKRHFHVTPGACRKQYRVLEQA